MTLARRTDRTYPSFPSLFDNLFNTNWMDWSDSNFSNTNTTLPAINVKESNEAFEIEVAAPGMSKKDFNINLDNDLLTISSEKKDEKKEGKGKYSRREFSYQSFQRSFTIPQDLVEHDKIEAKYCDGILCITLPKKEEVKPKPKREIKIS